MYLRFTNRSSLFAVASPQEKAFPFAQRLVGVASPCGTLRERREEKGGAEYAEKEYFMIFIYLTACNCC
jgi:hypothetical protein